MWNEIVIIIINAELMRTEVYRGGKEDMLAYVNLVSVVIIQVWRKRKA